MMNQEQADQRGTILYGYCGGAFGREAYWPKRIEALGPDWIVARELEPGAAPLFAAFDSPAHMQIMLARFLSEHAHERD